WSPEASDSGVRRGLVHVEAGHDLHVEHLVGGGAHDAVDVEAAGGLDLLDGLFGSGPELAVAVDAAAEDLEAALEVLHVRAIDAALERAEERCAGVLAVVALALRLEAALNAVHAIGAETIGDALLDELHRARPDDAVDRVAEHELKLLDSLFGVGAEGAVRIDAEAEADELRLKLFDVGALRPRLDEFAHGSSSSGALHSGSWRGYRPTSAMSAEFGAGA